MPLTAPKQILPLATLAAAGESVSHLRSLPPVSVPMPPLRTGALFFDLWLVREAPEPGAWAHATYESCSPALFEISNAVIHGNAGMISTNGAMIAETMPSPPAASASPLQQTATGQTAAGKNSQITAGKTQQTTAGKETPPAKAGSATVPAATGSKASGKTKASGNTKAGSKTRIESAAGLHISLLAPNAASPDVALLHTLARLACLEDQHLLRAETLLLPAGTRFLPEMLALLDLLPSLKLREVEPDALFAVESLLLPVTVSGGMSYHPCLRDFFARLSASVPPQKASGMPRRLYLTAASEQPGAAPPAFDEAAVLQALRPHGFTAIRFDTLSLTQRIALLRHAEAVVAPASPALAALGFCRPATRIVELLQAENISWHYRRLAALFQLNYDCVVGRNGTISPAHVAAAASCGLNTLQRAA